MAVKNGWLANPRDKADALKTRDMETRRGRGRKGWKIKEGKYERDRPERAGREKRRRRGKVEKR